jgi:hypothetical protein
MSAWTVYDLVEVDRPEQPSEAECLDKPSDNASKSRSALAHQSTMRGIISVIIDLSGDRVRVGAAAGNPEK